MELVQKIIKKYQGPRGGLRYIYECNQCSKLKDISNHNIKHGWGLFCSNSCNREYKKSLTLEKAAQWKGGRTRHQMGYIRIKKPEHHRADKSGYVFEHILVVEKKIGRDVLRKEEVHHINGVKDDNRIENLKLCADIKEHSRYENGWEFIDNKWFKVCKGCSIFKEIKTDNFYLRATGEFVYQCIPCCAKRFQEKQLLKNCPKAI